MAVRSWCMAQSGRWHLFLSRNAQRFPGPVPCLAAQCGDAFNRRAMARQCLGSEELIHDRNPTGPNGTIHCSDLFSFSHDWNVPWNIFIHIFTTLEDWNVTFTYLTHGSWSRMVHSNGNVTYSSTLRVQPWSSPSFGSSFVPSASLT